MLLASGFNMFTNIAPSKMLASVAGVVPWDWKMISRVAIRSPFFFPRRSFVHHIFSWKSLKSNPLTPDAAGFVSLTEDNYHLVQQLLFTWKVLSNYVNIWYFLQTTYGVNCFWFYCSSLYCTFVLLTKTIFTWSVKAWDDSMNAPNSRRDV